tara:strand:- start:263 stop:1192 length:930 start_codon:yes stop_codon:yes gene_type:complete
MINAIKIFVSFLFVFISIISNANSAENKILFKLNNDIITSVDILNEIKYLSIINKEFAKLDKNRKIEIAKNSQIRQKIKFIEISKFRKNLDLKNDVLENIIKNYFINLKIKNLKEFEIFFENQNLNTKFVKKKIIVDTIWKKLIYEKFSKSVKIDTSEIKANIAKMEKQKEYLFSEIVFDINENSEFEKKINLIKKTINDKTFSEAAFIYSISDTSKNGGKLGWVKESMLSKIIKNEIKLINIGEFTDPIVIPGGFLILYIEDIKEVKNEINKDEEIKFIIEKKTNDQLNLFSNIYLNKIKKTIQINEL